MIYSTHRDVTHIQRAPGPGASDMRQRWLCGHLHRTGVKRKVAGLPALLWRCADCAKKA